MPKLKLPDWALNKRRYTRPKSDTLKVVPSVPAGKGPFAVEAVTPEFGGGVSGVVTEVVSGEEHPCLKVPMSDEAGDFAIRVHEYAHLEYNREVPMHRREVDKLLKEGLSERFQQAGADVIVNALARNRGLGEDIRELPLDPLTPESNDETKALWLLRMASRTGTLPCFGSTKSIEGLGKETYNQVGVAADYLKTYGLAAIASMRRGDSAAATKQVQTAYRAVFELQKYLKASKAAKTITKPRDGADEASLMSLKSLIHGYMNDKEFVEMLGGTKAPKPEAGMNSWAYMTITVAPFDHTSKRKGVKKRPSFMGAMRTPFRLLLPAMDGRGWAIKRRFLGGTILIDHSGSMALPRQQLQEILMYAPLATIACYSGRGSTGTLTVLAKNGRYTSHIPASEDGNGVDGPALHWLAKQEGPRVWICDGGVSGKGDIQTMNLVADAFRIARMAGVIKFDSIPEYLQALGITPKDTA